MLPVVGIERGAQASGDRELTARQRQVLELLASGRTMKEIGAALRIAARTVAFHKYQMMEKLNITTNADLIKYAVRHDIG